MLLRFSFKLIPLFSLLILTVACTFPGVYKLDIPQGNIIEQAKIDQLEIGMNKRQVRYLMGTPLLKDSFNADRWDYFYSLKDYQENIVQQRMTVYFDQGKLSKVDKHLFSDQQAEIELNTDDTAAEAKGAEAEPVSN